MRRYGAGRVGAALPLRSVRRVGRRSRSARFAAWGALAHARLAALRRSRSRSGRRVAALPLEPGFPLVAALSLTLGSPRWAAALSLALGFPLWAAALSLALGFPLWAAVSGGGKGSLCDLLGGALAPLGSPRCGGALARARADFTS